VQRASENAQAERATTHRLEFTRGPRAEPCQAVSPAAKWIGTI